MRTSVAVAEHIRERIHAGRYGPGDRLPPQRELAVNLGVSRVSVREAFHSLVDEGYLQIRRGSAGGAFVTELSQPADVWQRRLLSQMDELDDLVDFRIAVERRVSYLAALRSTRADLTQMRTALRDMRSAATDDSRTHRMFRRADGQFHEALVAAARNRRLERAVIDARNEMFMPYDMLSFEEPWETVMSEHQGIYEAVRNGRADQAAERMTEHVQHTREQLRSFVAEGPPRT